MALGSGSNWIPVLIQETVSLDTCPPTQLVAWSCPTDLTIHDVFFVPQAEVASSTADAAVYVAKNGTVVGTLTVPDGTDDGDFVSVTWATVSATVGNYDLSLQRGDVLTIYVKTDPTDSSSVSVTGDFYLLVTGQ